MRNPSDLARRLLQAISAHHIAVGALGGVWLLVVSIAPLYKLRGAYEGLVSLTWYTIAFQGSEIDLAALNTVKVTSIAPVALALYLTVVQPVIARLASPLVAAEASVGGALAFLATGFAPTILARYVTVALEGLTGTLAYQSSAGLVWLGEVRVYTTPFLALASIKVYVALVAIYLLSSIVALDEAVKSGDAYPGSAS